MGTASVVWLTAVSTAPYCPLGPGLPASLAFLDQILLTMGRKTGFGWGLQCLGSLTVLTGQGDHQLIASQICRELRKAAFTVCIHLYRPLPTTGECLVLSTQRVGWFSNLTLPPWLYSTSGLGLLEKENIPTPRQTTHSELHIS